MVIAQINIEEILNVRKNIINYQSENNIIYGYDTNNELIYICENIPTVHDFYNVRNIEIDKFETSNNVTVGYKDDKIIYFTFAYTESFKINNFHYDWITLIAKINDNYLVEYDKSVNIGTCKAGISKLIKDRADAHRKTSKFQEEAIYNTKKQLYKYTGI